MVAILCVMAFSHYYLWRWSFNQGLEQGCEVTLEQLEIEQLIKVDNSNGEIYQWDRYKNGERKK